MHRDLPPEWDKPLQISLETARLIHVAPEGSCERIGTRDLIEFKKSSQKKQKETTHPEIYCFGGSTTFGHGVDQNETWPRHLQSFLIGSKVVNCGVVKNDLKASLHTFVSLARNQNVPHQVIFLDGVNESAGFKSWNPQFSNFVDYDTNYTKLQGLWNTRGLPRYTYLLIFIFGKFGQIFSGSISQNGIYQSLLNYKKRKKSLKTDEGIKPVKDGESMEFIRSAAESYVKSKNLITVIAKSLGIEKVYFFLQPTLFNVPGYEGENSRKHYLSTLYHLICEKDSDVIDISVKCGKIMKAEMFFDWQHPDSRGNLIIAEEISKYLK